MKSLNGMATLLKLGPLKIVWLTSEFSSEILCAQTKQLHKLYFFLKSRKSYITFALDINHTIYFDWLHLNLCFSHFLTTIWNLLERFVIVGWHSLYRHFFLIFSNLIIKMWVRKFLSHQSQRLLSQFLLAYLTLFATDFYLSFENVPISYTDKRFWSLTYINLYYTNHYYGSHV